MAGIGPYNLVVIKKTSFLPYEEVVGTLPCNAHFASLLHVNWKNRFPSGQTNRMQVPSAKARLTIWIFVIKSQIVRRFFYDIRFIVFVYVVSEMSNKTWKWSTMCYEKAVAALSVKSFGIVLAISLVHSVAVIFNINSSYYITFVVYWKAQRTRQGAINGRHCECHTVHLIVCD